MLVSCLCVTEDRPAFIPWLLWNFEKQTYPNCELVVVDSSSESIRELLPESVILVHAEHGSSVGAKRNLALEICRGEAITWMDDDDWQHPDKCSILAESLGQGHDVAGCRSAFFLDLLSLRTRQFSSRRRLIFNSLGVRTEIARQIVFPEKVHKASDTEWMKKRLFRRICG